MGYWDSPDGTQCVEKAWITTKLGTAIGLVGSAYHIVAFQPESAMAGLKRATSATVTMASLGAVFGMATCLSAQARGTSDDPLNYLIGGCASGAFLGARTHNPMVGTSACLGLGALAYFTKVGKQEGWRLTGTPRL
ncbi:NADH dehydrogenase [ubiquinone] 1 alpha subcomplex subunit 11 [Eucyclogobius newberryi]|uniref:NADH dehydrogenase [ubiquinone] 1 alpha subcomplex subunit 11 n=1 Tax=Eucyclogobius newberryi TaxID=166745 RepID=UPI003B5B8F5B